jgi:hypothetical protein
LSPPPQTAGRDADQLCHFCWTLASPEKFERLSAPMLQLFGSTDGSHTRYETTNQKKRTLIIQNSVNISV